MAQEELKGPGLGRIGATITGDSNELGSADPRHSSSRLATTPVVEQRARSRASHAIVSARTDGHVADLDAVPDYASVTYNIPTADTLILILYNALINMTENGNC